MNKYNVAIIGCGSIGALKLDKYDSPKTKNILTHAHACYNHPQIGKIGFFDTDLGKALKANNKWNGGYAARAILPSSDLDIVIVAAPTAVHYNILAEIARYKPGLVIAEKPFTTNWIDALNINTLYKSTGIPLLINYTRRFEPFHRRLKNDLDATQIYHCKITYTRGFKREASHAIDLCSWWFGKYIGGDRIGGSINDYSDNDLSFTAHLSYEKCPSVFFTPVDSRKYSIFEIDIFTDKGRYTIVDNGRLIRIYQPTKETIYGDYNRMPTIPYSTLQTDLTQSLTHLLQNAIDHLEKSAELLCTGKEALAVHKIYKDLEI
jgi:predicted dehydrogenase